MTYDIVLVDDHKLVRDGVRTLLERGSDFRVVGEAESGPDAVQLCKKSPPDLVLMDIGLPGLDGYEVARRLRSDPTLRNRREKMSLIALTGYGQLTDIALTREAGFDAHLTKPYELDELEKLLLRLGPT